MSKTEILIETEDTEFAKRFFKFLEAQPKERASKTRVTLLEEGTKQLLDKVLEGANELVAIRRDRQKRLNEIVNIRLNEEIVD